VTLLLKIHVGVITWQQLQEMAFGLVDRRLSAPKWMSKAMANQKKILLQLQPTVTD